MVITQNTPGNRPSGPKPMLPEDRRSRQGAWLLIASLAVFFFASLLLYAIYVSLRVINGQTLPLELPKSLYVSTVILIGISASLHLAVGAAQRDESKWLIQMVSAALALSLLFFVVQGEGMYWLLAGVRRTEMANNNAYAFTFLLVLVHALHVVGGLVSLTWVFVNSLRRCYDHERWWAVQFCALYWHFLDIVWIILVFGFLIAGWVLQP